MKGYIAKHNRDYNLKDVERLVPLGFAHTTGDMWRKFCRHVVDVENAYIEKDGILEDAVDEMVIQLGGVDDSNDDEEDEECLMDDNDRQLITTALRQTAQTCEQSTSTQTPTHEPSTSTSTHSIFTQTRRQLSEQFDAQFLRDVLPLHMIPPEPHSTLPEQDPAMSGSDDQ